MQMRSDYSFCALAIVFFMVTVVPAWALAATFQMILISISALFGMISLGFGLTLRSKSLQTNQTPQTSPSQEITQTEPSQSSKIENLAPPPVPMQPETSIVNPPAVTTLVPMETEVTAIQTVPVIAVPTMLPEQPSTLMSIKQSTLPLKETALTEVRGIGQKQANRLDLRH
jgi:hypothetical protein